MTNSINKLIAKTFEDIASGLETGSFKDKPRIALTGIGSEHGEENVLRGATHAKHNGENILYIGTLEDKRIKTISVKDDREAHDIMEKLLNEKEIDGAVTMHYPFPIGVSTVGRVITPGTGRYIYIATTTGTSSTDRTKSMVKNTIYGISCAKACGIENPSVGVLNIDGARQTEGILKELNKNGYNINFGESLRADGGMILRGNDILAGSCDVIVMDSLTGNIIIKMLSSFTTGGNYESIGCGYGPGIGEDYEKLIMIVSRSSGSPVISNAISYASELIEGNYRDILREEFKKAREAGMDSLLERVVKVSGEKSETVKTPKKEIVTEEIPGIEITELDEAVESLWNQEVYAESGMGCTGPVVLINEKNKEKAREILINGGWISEL